MAKMITLARRGDRLEQLKGLAKIIAKNIDNCEDDKILPQLAKQYRETIREIEDIEGVDEEDGIGEILQARKVDGQPSSVR